MIADIREHPQPVEWMRRNPTFDQESKLIIILDIQRRVATKIEPIIAHTCPGIQRNGVTKREPVPQRNIQVAQVKLRTLDSGTVILQQ